MSSHEDTATAAQPRHHRHSGGISLTAGSTTLRLTDFVIDPLRGQLTARVGDARVPILALGYATARVDPVRHVAAGSGRRLADRRGGLRAQRRIRAPGRNGPGSKVAVASELGTLAVLTRDGAIVGEKDLGALPVPAWLPDGDLLAATWLGNVVRLNQGLKPKWERRIVPTETDTRSKLLAQDTTPTVRKDGWGNADAAPRPLTPNLLADTQALIRPVYDPPGPGGTPAWPDTFDALTDGKPDAPTRPWLRWTDVGYVDSGWLEKLVLGVDTFRTQLRLTAITFVEDPAHPESWLRDLRLQPWDAEASRWRDGPLLLSNTSVHSHTLDPPIEAARFRFTSTGGGSWPAGNIRLGELVFHGQSLGASHPDVIAKRPVAVLFDEHEDDLNSLTYPTQPFAFRYTDAYSGGKCLELYAPGSAAPNWRPPFGHAIPNWDFEIAENPQPGQYRYLHFAWKARSPTTTGMRLLIGYNWPAGGVAVTVGTITGNEGVITEVHVGGGPPPDWATQRIDLWSVTNGKPPRIQALILFAAGGGALFDHILLGRTQADLPP